jgi:hypothetical protein
MKMEETKNKLLETADDLTAYIRSLEFDLKMYVVMATLGDLIDENNLCEDCKYE